jgi:MFS family permease
MENNIITPLEAVNEKKLKKAVRKNIILLLLGQSVSLFGTSIYTFAISLYILSTTGSGFNFSLSLALGTLPGVLFSPISGVIADRFDRKKWLC